MEQVEIDRLAAHYVLDLAWTALNSDAQDSGYLALSDEDYADVVSSAFRQIEKTRAMLNLFNPAP